MHHTLAHVCHVTLTPCYDSTCARTATLPPGPMRRMRSRWTGHCRPRATARAARFTLTATHGCVVWQNNVMTSCGLATVGKGRNRGQGEQLEGPTYGYFSMGRRRMTAWHTPQASCSLLERLGRSGHAHSVAAVATGQHMGGCYKLGLRRVARALPVVHNRLYNRNHSRSGGLGCARLAALLRRDADASVRAGHAEHVLVERRSGHDQDVA